MSSERQIEANRRNGLKGGPKSDAGKERSRLNSLKHGLTSSTLVVLPEGDRDEYEEIRFFGSIAGVALLDGGSELAIANADKTVGGLLTFERTAQGYGDYGSFGKQVARNGVRWSQGSSNHMTDDIVV